MSRSVLFSLLSALTLSFSSLLFAQGMMPGLGSDSKTTKTDSEKGVPIGHLVSAQLMVTDLGGHSRPILSYKAATDVLVVGFFSPRCDIDSKDWKALKRMHTRYKGWKVSFLALSVNTDESVDQLASAFTSENILWDLARDDDQKASRALRIASTPTYVIIDEGGHLQYRGPVQHVPEALDVLVGHIERVQTPEPTDLKGCAIH